MYVCNVNGIRNNNIIVYVWLFWECNAQMNFSRDAALRYVWRISLILAPIMSTISLRVQEKSFEKHPVLMYRETKLHGFLASAKHLKHSHYNPCKRVPNIVTVVEKFKHAVNNS